MLCKNNQTFRTIIHAIFTPKRYINSEPIKRISKIWTFEESKKLIELVEKHGTNWKRIHEHFEDRSRKSVRSRYNVILHSSGGLKALLNHETEFVPKAWNQKEDELLLSLVKTQGAKWVELSSHFRDRNARDLSERYTDLDNRKKTRNGSWTEAEKRKFLALVKNHGNDFKTIASIIKTRNVAQCRSRYGYLQNRVSSVTDLQQFQIRQLEQAVKEHGIEDFELLVKEANLPSTLDEIEIRKYYKQEMDPKIVRTPWTNQEVTTMIQLYNELDGCMDLVQLRLPTKRSLKDMWTQYNEHCK